MTSCISIVRSLCPVNQGFPYASARQPLSGVGCGPAGNSVSVGSSVSVAAGGTLIVAVGVGVNVRVGDGNAIDVAVSIGVAVFDSGVSVGRG